MLTLIAAVILAISGHYPQRTFDLVMGPNRWCYRVLAYVADKRRISAVPARHRRHRPPGHLSPLPAGPPHAVAAGGLGTSTQATKTPGRIGLDAHVWRKTASSVAAAPRRRREDVETDLFVLEGPAGSYLLNSRSQNDRGGEPRTTRRYSAADAVTTSLMACRIRREATGSPEHTR